MEHEILESISRFCKQRQHEFILEDIELDGYDNIGNERLIAYLEKMLCAIDENPDIGTPRPPSKKIEYYFQYDNTKAAYVYILFQHKKGEQEVRLKSIFYRTQVITHELKSKPYFIPIESHP